MKRRYAGSCRSCGKHVSTLASEKAGSVRVRCRECGETTYLHATDVEQRE